MMVGSIALDDKHPWTNRLFAIGPGRAVRRVGAIHSAPLFHLSTGDRCLLYDVPAGIELRDVGPVLPAETFSRASIVTD